MNILKNPHFDAQRCTYCNLWMQDGHESGFFMCQNHNIIVGFMYQQSNELVYRIFMRKDDEFIIQMMFDVRNNEFNLIKMPTIKPGQDTLSTQGLVKLSFLPDIQPEQFDEYLEKLLNMQVFT